MNPVTTQSLPRSVEATDLDPKKIVVHPLNPRETTDPDPGLVESVKALGVLERLVLAPVPADLPAGAAQAVKRGAEFLLVAGHRRRAAAVAAKLKTVPVDIRHDLDTTEKQLAAIAAENVHRQDLTVLEEGDLYLALGDLGLTQGQINERTGVAKLRVSERSRVARLPGNVREKLAGGQLTLESGLSLARLVDDPDELARITRLPTYVWVQEVDRVLRDKQHARDTAARRKALGKAGVKVLDSFPADGDEGNAWQVLEDLLSSVWDAAAREVAARRGVEAGEEFVDSLDWEDLEEWHSQTCEGHAVVPREESNRWGSGARTEFVTICTTPTAHDGLYPDGQAPGTARDRDALEGRSTPEAEAEDQDLAAVLAEAAATRRAWLADLLKDTDRAAGAAWAMLKSTVDQTARNGAPVNSLHSDLRAGYRTEESVEVACALLADLGGPTATYPDAGSVIAAWAASSPEASSLPRLALATFLTAHAAREVSLTTNHAEWDHTVRGGYCSPWVATLDVIGYPWTATELQWLARDPAQGSDESDGPVAATSSPGDAA